MFFFNDIFTFRVFSSPKYDHSPPKVKRGITLAALITLAESSSDFVGWFARWQDVPRRISSKTSAPHQGSRNEFFLLSWTSTREEDMIHQLSDDFNSWNHPVTPEGTPLWGHITETKCNEREREGLKTPRVSRLDESYCERVCICKEKRVADGGEGSFVMTPAANKKIEEHELEQRKGKCCFLLTTTSSWKWSVIPVSLSDPIEYMRASWWSLWVDDRNITSPSCNPGTACHLMAVFLSKHQNHLETRSCLPLWGGHPCEADGLVLWRMEWFLAVGSWFDLARNGPKTSIWDGYLTWIHLR